MSTLKVVPKKPTYEELEAEVERLREALREIRGHLDRERTQRVLIFRGLNAELRQARNIIRRYQALCQQLVDRIERHSAAQQS